MKQNTTYTLNEVAMRLCPSKNDEALAFVARQIKHWTNYNLLQTVGEKHTGTGRSRRYSFNEVICAAYLQELTKNKLTIKDLVKFRVQFDEWMNEDSSMRLLSGKGESIQKGFLLYMTPELDNAASRPFSLLEQIFLTADGFWEICLNDHEHIDRTSALIINCNKVVARLNH